MLANKSAAKGLWTKNLPGRMRVAAYLLTGLALPSTAMATVLLASLVGTPSSLSLCPKAACPVVAPGNLVAGRLVPVYEFSGGYGRVSGYFSRAEAQKRFLEIDPKLLPEQPALWIRQSFVSSGGEAAGQPVSAIPAAIPAPGPLVAKSPPGLQAVLPVPARAPRGAKQKLENAAAVQREAAPKSAKPETQQVPRPAAGTLPDQPQAGPANPVLAAAGPASRPQSAKRPTTLAPQLLDKRLAKLPKKPTGDITLAQIIALRHEGLGYIESGACTSIKEGGKTASAGYLYLICEDDESYRLFAE